MKAYWLGPFGMAAWLACASAGLQAATPAAGTSGDMPGPARVPAGSALTATERSFMTRAAASGLYEVEASTLATQKAASPAVKAFADMLVRHHTDANSELMKIGSQHKIALPARAQLPAAKQAVINRLSKSSGTGFDRDYLRTVGIADHQADIKLFEQASRTTRNPALKAWVDKNLPVLRQHLSQAQQIPQPTAALPDNSGMHNPHHQETS
ncbi:MAG: hypothetical protein JWR60_2089 [Polaromonas sp.]|nr:hypothetical protein [Polaromonas sp.]